MRFRLRSLDVPRPVLAAVLLALLCGGACATAPPPSKELARVQRVVRTAEAMGAERDPRAALHLKLAQEQLAVARQLMLAGRNHRARALLERAWADAELAMALTRQTSARDDAARVRAEVAGLLENVEGT